jgi:hypothetical protein
MFTLSTLVILPTLKSSLEGTIASSSCPPACPGFSVIKCFEMRNVLSNHQMVYPSFYLKVLFQYFYHNFAMQNIQVKKKKKKKKKEKKREMKV